MLIPFTAQRRGHTELDWLDSYHSFSFGEFYDPERMGMSVLRVINDDILHGGGGFGAHPHRDMEIITYMVSGTIEHRDSLGNVTRIEPGEVQRMTAGTGITHSEYNASAGDPLRLLQIWIKPAQQNLTPSYEQKRIAQIDGINWIVSGDQTPNTLHIHQDVRIARVASAGTQELKLAAQRIGFIQVVHGAATVGSQQLAVGDGLAVVDERQLQIQLAADSEILWFDLPNRANH
ncbi:MAG TPA: pirin family protein [Spongiibacteraceae bacterium]|nr:pirin family protein [Spongiibacteraceae bacterium]